MLTLQAEFSEFVSARMLEQGWSTYDVARQASGLISHQTVWSICNDCPKDIKLSTLLALARGIRVSEEELFDRARGRSQARPATELRAIAFFKELPQERQEDALRLLETLHRQYATHVPAEVTGRTKSPRRGAA